jgi:hypothetical protein
VCSSDLLVRPPGLTLLISPPNLPLPISPFPPFGTTSPSSGQPIAVGVQPCAWQEEVQLIRHMQDFVKKRAAADAAYAAALDDLNRTASVRPGSTAACVQTQAHHASPSRLCKGRIHSFSSPHGPVFEVCIPTLAMHGSSPPLAFTAALGGIRRCGK